MSKEIDIMTFLKSGQFSKGTTVEITEPADYRGCKGEYDGTKWVPTKDSRPWISRHNKEAVSHISNNDPEYHSKDHWLSYAASTNHIVSDSQAHKGKLIVIKE